MTSAETNHLEIAERHLLALRAIIDRMAANGENAGLRVLASRLSQLAFRAAPWATEASDADARRK